MGTARAAPLQEVKMIGLTDNKTIAILMALILTILLVALAAPSFLERSISWILSLLLGFLMS